MAADFRDDTSFVTGDRDLNLLVRWDWHPDPKGEDPDELWLWFVMQRKGFLCSHFITVSKDDEPEIKAFLAECAKTTAALWAPLGFGSPNTFSNTRANIVIAIDL